MLRVTRLIDNAGETSGHVPRFDAGNHDYYNMASDKTLPSKSPCQHNQFVKKRSYHFYPSNMVLTEDIIYSESKITELLANGDYDTAGLSEPYCHFTAQNGLTPPAMGGFWHPSSASGTLRSDELLSGPGAADLDVAIEHRLRNSLNAVNRGLNSRTRLYCK
ncbi:unnamed protein product [Protopolystoma xenopodis]|uniref:Uncharacterized protein n=1 Tax=Protopolystoma xenopodis TaxID=117903 RepID=A0A448WNR1_9PLAT|nr:unnamed protein product [Protopolystoma xenopodis]